MPNGDAMTPPELAGDAPVADAFEPIEVGFGIAGGVEFDAAGGDSFDLSPVLLGGDAGDLTRRTAILQTGRGLLAFRDGDWKLRFTERPAWTDGKATFPEAAYELYNLAEDPFEQNDRAREIPERVAAMKSRLMGLLEKGRTR